MKVKFTKLAALLLAGAALFATGCTDYEVDIQKVDKKVDNLTSEVNTKIASLEQQIAGINATIATLETQAKHDEDIQKLNKTISDLETALKADYEKKINDAVTALNSSLADLTAQMNTELDKKLDKTTFEAAKQQIEQAIQSANEKIQALEAADEAFKTQIANLTTQFTTALAALDAKITALDEKKADKTQVAADLAALKTELETKIATLESTINGEITSLKGRMDAAEAAITDIKTNLIPGLQGQIDALDAARKAMEKDIKDLQDGKLDKATFEEYKQATASTLALMQASINDLVALTAGFPEGKTIKQYVDGLYEEIIAKFDDYVLKTYFNEVVATLATKAEVTALKTNLEGQIAQLKTYVDTQDEALKAYADGKIADLQAQIDDITNEEKTGRLDVLEVAEAALEKLVKETILPQVQFALNYEGEYGVGLQGYIDDGDAWALSEAKKYTDSKIQLVMDVINDIYEELYGVISEALARVQSIAFVPEYDDNKITVDLVYNVDPQTGKWTVLGKETVITYKVTPADAAKAVVAEWKNKPESFYFDVKTVKTRADEVAEELTPDFKVTKVEMNAENADKGWVDVTVVPVNIASEFFAFNQTTPIAPVEKPMGWAFFGDYPTNDWYANNYDGWYWYNEDMDPTWGWYYVYTGGNAEYQYYYSQYSVLYDAEEEAYYNYLILFLTYMYGGNVSYDEVEAAAEAWSAAEDALNDYLDDLDYYGYDLDEIIDGYSDDIDLIDEHFYQMAEAYDKYFEDMQNKAQATTFAAALVIDSAVESKASFNEDFTEIPVNLSSQFNVLYPSKYEDSDQFTILNDPYVKDETGKYVPVEEHQKLPYNSNEIKTIFKDAVAVVEYKGELYSYQDLRDMGFYVPELPETKGVVNFKAAAGKNYANNSDKIKAFFELDSETKTLPISADHELINSYDVQMNQSRTFSELAEAVGDKVEATYQFYTLVGSFTATGDVEVTKPLYTVNATATIDWTYDEDKEVDHARYYLRKDVYDLQSEAYTDEEKIYNRDEVEIILKAEDVAAVLDGSGLTLEDFAAITEEPELKVEVAAKEGDEAIAEADAAALAAAVQFTSLTFDPETQELTVKAKGFEFDKVYTVSAVYKNDLPIEFTLLTVLTTNDRPRETMIVNLTPYPKNVLVNGPEYDAQTDYYTVQSDDVRDAVQTLFVDGGILTVGTDGDYATTDDFVAGELIFKKAFADRENNTELPVAKQTKWLDIRQVYATTDGRKVTSAVLKEIDGQDLVRTVSTYIGQEIELTWKLAVELPVFDFQHNDTFVTSGAPIYVEEETAAPAPAPRRAKENGDVYYTDVHPDYDTREVLSHFDVSNVDLIARPFDIVDKDGKKLIVDPDQDIDEIADNNLIVYFTWREAPKDERIVWVEEEEKAQHTIDYGGLDPVVRVVGHIEMAAAGNPEVTFTLPTKFDEDKLYDKFEVRQFKPFKDLVADGITVDISRHIIVETNIFDGIKFEDVRGKLLYDNGWVEGDGTAANGFAEGIMSYEAYGIDWETALDFKTDGVPEDLRSLIWFDKETQTMFFDYRSELPLYKDNTFNVTVTITTQWQILEATFPVTIPKNM